MADRRTIGGIVAVCAGISILLTIGLAVHYQCLHRPTRAYVQSNQSNLPPPLPIHVDCAPRLGRITLGAFAPETMPFTSISLESLDSDYAYAQYRAAVRSCYRVDLADMNYLGVGLPNWQARYSSLDHWLVRASKYGDPTIAIEPIGPSGYGAFTDGPEMASLRSVFGDAASKGITVWVRFASESNLKYSVYSVYNNPCKITEYRNSVRWFRAYMPKNVRLVFSPLINTAYLQNPKQLFTLRRMYEPGAYDRIGGTLYATSWLRPRIAFDWYYRFMRQVDPSTPFQICELGSIYPRSDEVRAFLIRVAAGQWPGVQRVNLFAGDLNPLAVNEHGHFGFILPGENSSYLSDLLASGASSDAVSLDSAHLSHLEELGAGWRSPLMTLTGTVVTYPNRLGDFYLSAEDVTDDLGVCTALSPARSKHIVLSEDCIGAETVTMLHIGQSIQVTGWDSGSGSALRATQIIEQ